MFFFSSIPLVLIPNTFLISCNVISNYSTEILVTRIIDGDTFESKNSKYRILGIDTPETYDSNNNFKPTTGSQFFYGTQAKNIARNKLQNQYVEIESLKTDKYNRKIARVSVNGNDFASYMIQNGYAIVRYISTNKNNPFYYYDQYYVENLYRLQEEAKQNKKGFWIEPSNVIKQIFP